MWGLEAALTPPDLEEGDMFGRSVAIDGDTLVAAATYDDDNGVDSGSAYVDEFGATVRTTWNLALKITPPDGAASDAFGSPHGGVSLDGNLLIVGALGADVAGHSDAED